MIVLTCLLTRRRIGAYLDGALRTQAPNRRGTPERMRTVSG
jgi:hypothetical protein